MGVPTVLYLNDFDTATLGLVVQSVLGVGAAPTVRPATRTTYGRAGVLRLSPVPALEPRVIEVGAVLLADSQETARANLDTLVGVLMADCEVRVSAYSDRFWRATATSVTEVPLNGPQFLGGAIGLRLGLTCYDPLGMSRYLWSAGFSATLAPVELGDAPSAPTLVISGATNPTVSLYDAAGTARQTLGLTITQGANDFLTVDCAAGTITKSVSGTVSSALDTLTSGDFLLLDPAYGVVWLGISSGVGQALYRKAWL